MLYNDCFSSGICEFLGITTENRQNIVIFRGNIINLGIVTIVFYECILNFTFKKLVKTINGAPPEFYIYCITVVELHNFLVKSVDGLDSFKSKVIKTHKN